MPADPTTDAVRRFNRFYTARIGALAETLPGGDLTLAQSRVLFELSYRAPCTAVEIGAVLGLDRGYLSRLLAGLVRQGHVHRARSQVDARRLVLSLTEDGQRCLARLEIEQSLAVEAMLHNLDFGDRAQLVGAMRRIRRLLDPGCETPAVCLRPPVPGELGWIVMRHAAVYAAEHRFSADFEGAVAGIVARFVERDDATRQRCWIAELDGEPAGSVMLAHRDDATAQLGVLLVERHARRLGIASRLVSECIGFARSAGYDRIMLLTYSILEPARALYGRSGFRLVESKPSESFGRSLTSERWELEL